MSDDGKLVAPDLKPPLQNSSSRRAKEPKELDKLIQWQQERIARKLRGEYESAIMHLSELVNGNMKTPTNVSSVRIEGAAHTRRSFLDSIITPIIPPQTSSTDEHPTTLEDVMHTTRRISHILRKTDIFSSIEASIDRPRDPQASVDSVDLIFKTKEKGKWFISSSTELGNNEASASATARVRNVFGGAEMLEANTSLGTKTRRAFRGSLTAPLTSDLATFGELSLYGMERDLSTFASCSEDMRGFKAIVRNGVPERGSHEVGYEAVVRHLTSLSPTASMSIREAAGTTVKSSLIHNILYDTRNDKITATHGFYSRFSQELAGLALGGDANFYKAEAEAQISRPLTNGVSISFAARSGIMLGLGTDKKTLFSDRFQLGGPNSIRSFRANTMGPRDGDDSIGGEFFYSAGLSLVSDLPSKAHWPVKAHAWLNAGRLDSLDRGTPIESSVLAALSRPSVSAGVGLIYRFDPVRIEVNLGFPLAASKSDGSRKGIQVGMGLEFL